MTQAVAFAPSSPAALPRIPLLGVHVTDATKAEASALLGGWIQARDGRSRSVFIVNAHSLNLACEDAGYRTVLNTGDVVFGDGTGVRLAAKLKGVRLKDNLVGTDLLPYFFQETGPRGYRYFLLGGTPDTPSRAAELLEREYPGIRLAGWRHGFVGPGEDSDVVAQINTAAPDVLLVGMGNPLQERWIHDHLAALRVPVSIGVGGLFDHWAGNLKRAPLWVRRLGVEWMQILMQQPHKWQRYLVGNPKFVSRALKDARWNGTGGKAA